jgi:hypothetical protein
MAEERTVELTVFLYALWLVAGLVDYLCHRRTDIAETSGAPESRLHVAQFLVLGQALLVATLLELTPLTLAWLAASVVVHSVLAFRDVAYTQDLRYISPLEQHVHGYLEVIPVVALVLFAVSNWDPMVQMPWTLEWRSAGLSSTALTLLLGSFFVLAGGPVAEELLRTSTNNKARWTVRPLASSSGTRRA